MRKVISALFSPDTFFWMWWEGERKSEQQDNFHLGNFEDARPSGKYFCRCHSFTC